MEKYYRNCDVMRKEESLKDFLLQYLNKYNLFPDDFTAEEAEVLTVEELSERIPEKKRVENGERIIALNENTLRAIENSTLEEIKARQEKDFEESYRYWLAANEEFTDTQNRLKNKIVELKAWNPEYRFLNDAIKEALIKDFEAELKWQELSLPEPVENRVAPEQYRVEILASLRKTVAYQKESLEELKKIVAKKESNIRRMKKFVDEVVKDVK